MSARPDRQQQQAYPLFAGLARPPLILGVPMIPLAVMVIAVLAVTMNFGIHWIALAPCLWLPMWLLTKHDVNIFRLGWLLIETRARNRNKSFWKASTYSHNKPSRGRVNGQFGSHDR